MKLENLFCHFRYFKQNMNRKITFIFCPFSYFSRALRRTNLIQRCLLDRNDLQSMQYLRINIFFLFLIRAQEYGWQDTYVFTKAMGEMMIDEMREDVPVVIVRPSVIESTFSEPFPGWMEGNRYLKSNIHLIQRKQILQVVLL